MTHRREPLRQSARRAGRSLVLLYFLLEAVAMISGCNQDERAATPPVQAKTQETDDLLVFDPAMRVPDDSVNDFVQRAMTTATSGDYAQFRLLWATRDEPMPKDQFEEGWQAVQQIRVRALEPAFVERPRNANANQPRKEQHNADAGQMEVDRGEAPIAQGEEPGTEQVYLILAEVRFDPQHPAARKEPTREAVMMVVREQEQWKLAHAPKLMRDWLREKAGLKPVQNGSDKKGG